MKKLIFVVIFIIILLLIKLYIPKDEAGSSSNKTLESQAWVLNGKEYKFVNTVGDVFVMHGPKGNPSKINEGFMNNPAFIIANNGLIVIDPGSSYLVGKKVIKQIEQISTKPILAVFNTHIHGDHWLGNQAIIEKYPDAKIYAHPKMIVDAKNGEGDEWVELMNTLTEGLSKGTVATYPTNAAENQQVITIDNKQFKVHSPYARSHTDTDIMIENIDDKVLFLGDNGLNNRMGRFTDISSMLNNIKTLEYAIALNLPHYTPGHGLSGNANTAVKPFLDYLKILKTNVKKGYDDDLADFEIKPLVLEKVKDYQNWSEFDEQFGRNINKMYLEIEELD